MNFTNFSYILKKYPGTILATYIKTYYTKLIEHLERFYMLLNHSQIQSPGLRHLTTAHLAQTMTLLSMTMVELRQKIEAELATNPALEIMDERRCPNCNRVVAVYGQCPICSHPATPNQEEQIVYLSDRRDLYTSSQGNNVSVSDLPDDNFIP